MNFIGILVVLFCVAILTVIIAQRSCTGCNGINGTESPSVPLPGHKPIPNSPSVPLPGHKPIPNNPKGPKQCTGYNHGTDDNHCPKQCSPFMYPNMYNPRGNCSDPFSWGFTYSTGRCPKAFGLRQLPEQRKENFGHPFHHGIHHLQSSSKRDKDNNYNRKYNYS